MYFFKYAYFLKFIYFLSSSNFLKLMHLSYSSTFFLKEFMNLKILCELEKSTRIWTSFAQKYVDFKNYFNLKQVREFQTKFMDYKRNTDLKKNADFEKHVDLK